MSVTFWLIGGLALAMAALAWLCAGAQTRVSYRVGAVVALVIGIGIGFVAISELMGRPKPIDQAWMERNEPSARVLSMRLVRDEAIYLWLLLPNDPVPRAYSLPWMRRTAEKLDDAMQKAGQRNQRVEIQGPMSKWSLYSDGELPLSILAPPMPPQKSPPNKPRTVDPGI